MAAKLKYPVGIQSFDKLRKEGYLYVDKTAYIYKLITEGCPYFLSRPRRFGKSLLISTLQAVFEGRHELFEAFTTDYGIEQPQLFIARSNWKWEKYPVLRFDFSSGDLSTIEQLDTLIDFTLSEYEKQYNITPPAHDANVRMVNLMRTLHKETGKRVVVLVDEYDNFILHSLGDNEKVRQARQRFQNVFGPLKAEDDHLQFAFITGISKFSQMGIFSKLNNLKNISMRNDYAAICGVSEEELLSQLQPDIMLMAKRNDTTYNDMFAKIKERYDGYHFSEAMEDIYNPFSLFNAFDEGKLGDYWFDRGTSGALIKMLAQMPPIDTTAIEAENFERSTFDLPFESFETPLPILYQSGYLTLKSYDREFEDYRLGIPNREVRQGFSQCLYKHVTASWGTRQGNGLYQAYSKFRRDYNLAAFIESFKTFFSGIPYQWAVDNQNEHYYHALLYTLLTSYGADLRAEEPTAKGQADLTLLMPKGIYVMEIKYEHTSQEALDQIDRKGYAEKYLLDGRPVTKIGISFSSEERNIIDWKAVSL